MNIAVDCRWSSSRNANEGALTVTDSDRGVILFVVNNLKKLIEGDDRDFVGGSKQMEGTAVHNFIKELAGNDSFSSIKLGVNSYVHDQDG